MASIFRRLFDRPGPDWFDAVFGPWRESDIYLPLEPGQSPDPRLERYDVLKGLRRAAEGFEQFKGLRERLKQQNRR